MSSPAAPYVTVKKIFGPLADVSKNHRPAVNVSFRGVAPVAAAPLSVFGLAWPWPRRSPAFVDWSATITLYFPAFSVFTGLPPSVSAGFPLASTRSAMDDAPSDFPADEPDEDFGSVDA